MKEIKYISCILIIAFALTGCQQKERIVYESSYLTITRAGAHIKLVDHANSRTFNYTLRKVKRKQNGTANAKTVLRTNDFTIISAGGVWRIVMQDQPDIYIRW